MEHVTRQVSKADDRDTEYQATITKQPRRTSKESISPRTAISKDQGVIGQHQTNYDHDAAEHQIASRDSYRNESVINTVLSKVSFDNKWSKFDCFIFIC